MYVEYVRATNTSVIMSTVSTNNIAYTIQYIACFDLCVCNSIAVFTTNWKFWCCCIHCLFGVNECQQFIYTHTFPFIPTWQIYVSHFCWLDAQLMNTRLVTMSVSLRTQTGLRCLIIQVLNTRVLFLNIQYTSFTSVHNNSEHGLAILTESFSPLRSEFHNRLVEVQIRSPLQ